MDKETYEYLTREVESDIEKQQLELESELQEKLKSQVFLGKTEEERNALKIKAEEQLRLEKESKLKSYTKNIEAQHFANYGGS
jgi:galactokinase/mevalonate kinase-like predicted kinase